MDPIFSKLTIFGYQGVLVFAVILIACLYFAYRWALPKPLPGIPYNKAATKQLFGDIPALLHHITNTGMTFAEWTNAQVRIHNSPIMQCFIRPLGKPVIILSDFREAQDILMRRKEFDRSDILGEIFGGIVPTHHIHQRTDGVWKAHRRLLQDLMSPPFLNKVAGPAIHKQASDLIKLWELKLGIAGNRPFDAELDIYDAALDAVLAFAFGGSFAHRATEPKIMYLEQEGSNQSSADPKGDDEPFVFDQGPRDEFIKAIFTISHTFSKMNGRPLPHLVWKYNASKSPLKPAIKLKNDCITRELELVAERVRNDSSEASVRSAVEHMAHREKKLAEKDGRAPKYVSPVMLDETFGFIIAGHETTSTTVLWALKLLADHPPVQTQLREALQSAFPAARAAKRHPSIEEITSASIPYMDAVAEELLRCAGTVPGVDRQAQCDTEVLGHRIPKGTIVIMLGIGPGLLSPALDVDESLRSESSRAAKADHHRGDRAWDPADVASFKPERWLVAGGSPGSCSFDSSAGPQLAFGLGTRGCFGKRLAYLELRILLTLVIWNFELLKCPDELSGYKAIAVITRKPRQCYVRLRKVRL
ncbi:cytochrome P450 [Xylariales sp. PMI_506]|nr:cytochrome P450 [Xylariales sp. PMI_506]